MGTRGIPGLTTSWQRPVTHSERCVCGNDPLQSQRLKAGGGNSGWRACVRALESPGGSLGRAEVWFVLTPGFGYSGHFAKPQKGELQGWTCYQKKPPGDRAFHSSPRHVDPDFYVLTLPCAGPIPGLRCARMTGETRRQSSSLSAHGEPAKLLTTS